MSEPRDYSREAAHRRYEKAADVAADAGSTTQAGLLDAYKNLLQDADWVPEEGWADAFQEGVEAYTPNRIQETAAPEWSIQEPVSSAPRGSGEDSFYDRYKAAQEDLRDRESGLNGYETVDQEIEPSFEAGPKYDPSVSFVGSFDAMLGGPEARADSSTNSLYENLFAQQGYDPNADQDNWWDSLGRWFSLSGAGTNPELQAARYADPVTYGDPSTAQEAQRESGDALLHAISRYRDQGVDDGTLNSGNLTSNFMTVDQALKYREAGIPGRDIDELRELAENNPGMIINKRQEQDKYGFVPYIPDDLAYTKLATQNVLAMPSDAASALGTAREDNTSYTINLDGRSINSKDFDLDKAHRWYLNAQKDVEENPRPEEILDPDGNVLFVQTSPVVDAAMLDPEGNEISVTFEDGRSITLDGEGYGSAMEEYDYLFGEGSEEHRRMQESSLPQYEMDNSEPVGFYDVYRILADNQAMAGDDHESKDAGINYDFGFANWNKPSAYMGELTKGDWADFLPKMTDTLAQSAPYFVRKIAYPVGMSDAYLASRNISPEYTDNDRTYKGWGEIDDETRKIMEEQGIDVDAYEDYRDNGLYLERILGNAIMPLTEYGWGNIGTRFANPLVKGAKKYLGEQEWMPAADVALGVGGEGVEEILGNLVEEGRRNGFTKSWYADYLRDENGDILRDSNGMPLQSQDATTAERVGRYGEDAPESALLGSLLGLGHALTLDLPRTINDTIDINTRRKREREIGFDPDYARYNSDRS